MRYLVPLVMVFVVGVTIVSFFLFVFGHVAPLFLDSVDSSYVSDKKETLMLLRDIGEWFGHAFFFLIGAIVGFIPQMFKVYENVHKYRPPRKAKKQAAEDDLPK